MMKNYVKIFLIFVSGLLLFFINFKNFIFKKINFITNDIKIHNKIQISIDKETMVKIITDLEILKAIIDTANYENQLKIEKIAEYKKNIFKNYGIDEDIFIFNAKLYSKNLNDFLNIYKSVENALEKITKDLSS